MRRRGKGDDRATPSTPLGRRRQRFIATLPLAALLAGCGLFGGSQEQPADAPEPAPVEEAKADPCAFGPPDGSLVGPFLRQHTENGDLEAFQLQAKAQLDGTPDSLKLAGRSLSHPALMVRAGAPGTMARTYDLGYEADGAVYLGPVIFGLAVEEDDLPTAGNGVYSGPVHLVFGGTAGNGASGPSVAGTFTMQLGYQSRTAGFAVAIDTASIRDARGLRELAWQPLGLCGSRVISTGAGRAVLRDARGRLLQTDGTPVRPFDRGSGARRSVMNATLFKPTGAARDGTAPRAVGGVFFIESDQGKLTGVFAGSAS